MTKDWIYSNAETCRAGLMICISCNRKITEGEFRYYETEEACRSQHRSCSKSDPTWARLDAEQEQRVRVVVPNTFKECAYKIKAAFEEGFESYATQAYPYNSAEEAWEESDAKRVYDELIKL